jgi:hypothetical protein
MITAAVLVHPQSADLIKRTAFNTKHSKGFRIACGTTRPDDIDFSEARDFHPSYSSWNSCLFESSVILTCWEHADKLFDNNHVAFIHTDIEPHFEPLIIWENVCEELDRNSLSSVALTMPTVYQGRFDEWELPEDIPMVAKNDPMLLHSFDNNIHVWDYIKRYDRDIYDFAMDANPRMIYSHQFACTRETFDYLGNCLYKISHRLKLQNVGLWTPHVFERLIALYLAKRGKPIITTAFWHHASSGTFGPGEFNLYGPRAFKCYKIMSRYQR